MQPGTGRLAAAMITALVVIAALLATSRLASSRSAPESATGTTQQQLAVATRTMIATPNAHATRAGLAMLRAGGSAADAAVAAALVLGLVEPQASGLGGGGFALTWDAGSHAVAAFDGRETAPMAARPDRFLAKGRPMPFATAVHSGLSIGTPGFVRLIEALHRRQGRLPWPALFEPAIRLAEQGFEVSPRLHALLAASGPAAFDATARAYFFDRSGKSLPVGHRLANPAYASTLRALAAEGADAFYRGPVAAGIVAAAAAAPNRAGDLTLADLAGYRVVERAPLCFEYRRHRVCSVGPPSSGGIAMAQALTMLEPFDLGAASKSAMNHRALHLIVEAEKLAFADRNSYVGDPAAVAIPSGLLDSGYLAERRALIRPDRTMVGARPGTPPRTGPTSFGGDATIEAAGTSHISVVDADGHAVSMTVTVESAFGSGVMTGGFLLNNELTDFSFRPRDALGRPAANAVGPGKRPRSSMAPTIVLAEDGRLAYVAGSTGGSGIIPYMVQALVALIDWQLDPQAAASLAHVGSRGGALDLELDGRATWLALQLRPYGHTMRLAPEVSGTHIIAVRNGRLEGGVDPRKEGLALGD